MCELRYKIRVFIQKAEYFNLILPILQSGLTFIQNYATSLLMVTSKYVEL